MKVSLFALALVVLGSVVVGCSGGGDTAENKDKPQIDASAKPAGKGPHASVGGAAGAPAAAAQ